MAAKTAENKPDQPDSEGTPAKASRLASLKKAILAKWLPLLIVGSVIAHVVMWSLHGDRAVATAKVPFGEVSLGEYYFEAPPAARGMVSAAKFKLHISLLKDMDSQARARLEARKFKVQQDVEELLRQAHGGDFEDPELDELKRQIQEQINASLELRAISDVIITDLSLSHENNSPQVTTPEAMRSETIVVEPAVEGIDASRVAPWEEKPAS
jgi:flagellar basal body-associated protein FliL